MHLIEYSLWDNTPFSKEDVERIVSFHLEQSTVTKQSFSHFLCFHPKIIVARDTVSHTLVGLGTFTFVPSVGSSLGRISLGIDTEYTNQEIVREIGKLLVEPSVVRSVRQIDIETTNPVVSDVFLELGFRRLGTSNIYRLEI